jgi:hypothetical protein
MAGNLRARSLLLIFTCVAHVGVLALLSLDSRHPRAAEPQPAPLLMTVFDEPQFVQERQPVQMQALASLPPIVVSAAPDALIVPAESAAPAMASRIDWMDEAVRSACNIIRRQEADGAPLACKRR